MRKTAYGVALAMTFSGTMIAAQKKAIREPKTCALDCSAGDCPLLKGVPQTRSMRGGSGKLKPGESVGWHSTAAKKKRL